MRFKVDLYVNELKLVITSNRFNLQNYCFLTSKNMEQINHRQP